MRIYEINTRVHCQAFSQITETELTDLSRLGFDAVWLMGVWQISNGARKISKLVSEDFEGSPYAVPSYKFSKQLGGKKQFAPLVERAHKAGLSVIVDFVSNHMALDSPWIDGHTEFFVRGNLRARNQTTAEYFLHCSGEVVAFGRDPYFPPWHDTAQLDYTSADLRARMIDVLKRIGRYADGVRCDMAMLVLRDYIRQQWYPLADQAWFDRAMPSEFWDQAIAQVKKARPDFQFIAEAYWDKEDQLAQLGFDLTYEKRMYDALVAKNADLVKQRLLRPAESIERSLYFIENHDEQRAAAVLSKPSNLAAAALMLSLPGSVLIHEGQMDGVTEKLPVQRVKPVEAHSPDLELRDDYQRLLSITRHQAFSGGNLLVFETGCYGAVSFARLGSGGAVAYIGQISEAWHKLNEVPLDVTELAAAVGAGDRLRITNLMTGASSAIHREEGRFKIVLKALGLDEESAFCLLEAAPA